MYSTLTVLSWDQAAMRVAVQMDLSTLKIPLVVGVYTVRNMLQHHVNYSHIE
jgi:hypothetical protein